MNDKKRSKVWSKDLVHKKTFRLSNHPPEQFYVMSRISISNKKLGCWYQMVI